MLSRIRPTNLRTLAAFPAWDLAIAGVGIWVLGGLWVGFREPIEPGAANCAVGALWRVWLWVGWGWGYGFAWLH